MQDIDFLADQLQLQRFFVLGVSGGGPYALACACFLAHRVKGVLLISSAGYPGEQPRQLRLSLLSGSAAHSASLVTLHWS